MDKVIKQAFSRVKEDIFYLGEEIQKIKLELLDLKTELKLISSFIEDLRLKNFLNPTPTHNQENQAIPTHTPTHPETPTDNLAYKALKSQDMPFSIGNRGVPTDRQTNQQTDQHMILEQKTPQNPSSKDKLDNLEKAKEILENLDNLKKELRIKFKAITPQELAVFSLIYQLDDEKQEVDYKLLATKLNLSESSIRDYILKIQKKGIPILKEKLNNKRIILHISQELRRIASLETILKLRTL
ncbi:MAG: HTH domain-containing protein [Candidatus Pacearchaeota archaeon]|nr:HTH domain-containing protein [Candidatus Pacearchaeota archaeon]